MPNKIDKILQSSPSRTCINNILGCLVILPPNAEILKHFFQLLHHLIEK